MDPRLTKLVESLELSKVLMIKICQAFQRHLSQGLLIHKNGGIPGEDVSICSLKMLDSCITNIPSGKETGVCYGLDFGGSNFRAVKAVLCGKGRIEIFQNSASLKESFQGHCPEGLVHAEVPGTHLFDRFSLQLKDLIDHREDTPMECSMNAENNPAVVPLGFTFSFPCLQESLNAARLITWTKEIETGRATECKVEGKDVAKMLQEAFLRHSIPARVFAVINDTVGTLISCAYQKSEDDPDCLIGLILGTGSNVCYYEPMAQEFNYKGNVINLEYGSFF
nr:hexokinase [Nephromyces sp. MMRI]